MKRDTEGGMVEENVEIQKLVMILILYNAMVPKLILKLVLY